MYTAKHVNVLEPEYIMFYEVTACNDLTLKLQQIRQVRDFWKRQAFLKENILSFLLNKPVLSMLVTFRQRCGRYARGNKYISRQSVWS